MESDSPLAELATQRDLHCISPRFAKRVVVWLLLGYLEGLGFHWKLRAELM